MYFLAGIDICESPTMNPVWDIVGTIIRTIWIGVPILLIIFGSIDLGKAVIASKEDEIKKATKTFGKRFLYAAAVFAVVWLVMAVLNLVSSIGLTSLDASDAKIEIDDWKKCWCKISKGSDYSIQEETNDKGEVTYKCKQ